jgi:multidrug efflux pump subunit AcrA (membrane-fusion protein)
MISGVLEPTISETALEARKKELSAASTIHKADEHFRCDVLKLYAAIDNKQKVLKSQLGQAQLNRAQRNRTGPSLSNPTHLLHRHQQIYFPHSPSH